MRMRLETHVCENAEQKFSIENERKLKGLVFDRRLDLLASVRNEKPMKIQANCPKCSYECKPIEILEGFNNDPEDTRTTCFVCGHRFESNVKFFTKGKLLTRPFYCNCQVLHKMGGLEVYSPIEYANKYDKIYRSALIHFGTLKAGYQKIKKEYNFEEVRQWENKIGPFLGKLPDQDIADIVGIYVNKVELLRKELNIKSFNLFEQTAV